MGERYPHQLIDENALRGHPTWGEIERLRAERDAALARAEAAEEELKVEREAYETNLDSFNEDRAGYVKERDAALARAEAAEKKLHDLLDGAWVVKPTETRARTTMAAQDESLRARAERAEADDAQSRAEIREWMTRERTAREERYAALEERDAALARAGAAEKANKNLAFNFATERRRLEEVCNESNAVCLCGCAMSGHDKDGACEDEAHECVFMSVVALGCFRELRSRMMLHAEREEFLANVLRQMRDSQSTSWIAYQNDARNAMAQYHHFPESKDMVMPETWTGVGMKPGPVTVKLAPTDAATSESNRETTSSSGGDEERDDDVCECGKYRGDHIDGLCYEHGPDDIPVGFQRRLPSVRPCSDPDCVAARSERDAARAEAATCKERLQVAEKDKTAAEGWMNHFKTELDEARAEAAELAGELTGQRQAVAWLEGENARLKAAIVEWATRRTLMDRWEHHDYNMPYDTAVRLEAAEAALLRIAGEKP